MSKSYKVTAPLDIELAEVQYMPVSAHHADVWLRKNVHNETMTNSAIDESDEGASYEIQCADEVYFQVDAEAITEDDIRDNFAKYWFYGLCWTDNTRLTDAEKIKALESENASLKQCIIELSGLI